LLDEADVFLQKRFEIIFERNRLVTVFLRKFEYFDGILFLTTNLLYQFDDAILNRIHLVMKYEELDRDVRKTIIVHFLKMAKTDRGPPNLSDRALDQKHYRHRLCLGRHKRFSVILFSYPSSSDSEWLHS
jgi:hypothetical protein